MICFLTSNIVATVAQNSNLDTKELALNVDEMVFIHANGTTFVSGEKLFYKLYLLNPADFKPSSLSKIAYVELIDITQQKVFSHKLFLNEGAGGGDFLIPSELQTGTYKLVAYTRLMQHRSSKNFFESAVFIINPFEKLKSSQIAISPTPFKANERAVSGHLNGAEQKDFSLQIPKRTYAKRERVDVRVQSMGNENPSGNFSLSIRKLDDLPTKKVASATEYAANFSIENSVESPGAILPELRGEIIEGKIISTSGQSDLKNQIVAFSIPGKAFAFHLAKTNSEGKFTFNLGKPYLQADLYMQVIGEKQQDFSIAVSEKKGVPSNELLFDEHFALSPAMKTAIQQRAVASQIENAYADKKTDSVKSQQGLQAFYEPIAKNYILADYNKFKTLKETSVEIIPEMYFSKKDNHNYVYVRDYSTTARLNEPALVLIDGLLIQNTDALADYNANLIHMVSVVTGAYYYEAKVFDGIVSIVTKNTDFVNQNPENVIYKVAVQRPIAEKTYYANDYSDAAKFERIPDYRNQLAWISSVPINEIVSFYTSDVSGNFEIVLEGFSSQGKPVSLRETFIVE